MQNEKTRSFHAIVELMVAIKDLEQVNVCLTRELEDCRGKLALLEGVRPGSVTINDDGSGWGYDGRCPWCNSDDIREKGSFDKCMACGKRISFWQ